MIFTPRPYQLAACAAVNAALSQGESGILVVIPTGGGKTPIMADLIHGWITQWPDTRVCVLAHRKKLVSQNAAKFAAYWQQQQKTAAPLGIYCAGLNQRNTTASALFAGIDSVAKKAMQLGAFDVLLIDEAHHIPTAKAEGIWHQFIADARRANPNVRVVGLSATPYRLGSGSIVGQDSILKRVCYEASIPDLIRDGYLCPLVTKSSDTKIDTSRLHIRQGEYVAAEVESLMDQDNLINDAVHDMIRYGADRKSWMVFCAGIKHANHMCAALNAAGIAAAVVSSENPQHHDAILSAFETQKLRAVCNVNVLSEGYDYPGIDLVALLFLSKSAGRYYQCVGRAFRLSPDKEDALILDYGGLIAEHGPVDQIRIKQKPISEEPGESPMKDCPQCNTPLHTAVRLCPNCGYEFPPPALAHDAQAAIDMPILSSQIKPIRHEITNVRYQHHVGKSGISTLRVDYYSGYVRVAQEWVCLEHEGYARQKAVKWWRDREPRPMQLQPGTVQQAIEWIHGGFQLTQPTAIHLRPGTGDKKYPEIVRFEWAENLAAVAA